MDSGQDAGLSPWRALSLESLGRLAALVGLLLPATGALSREVAFAMSGHIPAGVGLSLSVPQLALVGLHAMLPGVLTGVGLAWFVRRPPRLGWPGLPDLRGRSVSGRILAVLGYAAIVLAAGYAILPLVTVSVQSALKSLPAAIATMTSVAVIVWASRLAKSHAVLPWTRLLPVVLVVAAVTAAGMAVGPTTAGTYIADVSFAAESGLSDGTFSVLGEDGDTTWLLACEPGSGALRVRSDLIESMRIRTFGPEVRSRSLEETLKQGLGPGFVQQCP